ncbi:MAG: VWA domain-containing protein [Treponema sp.]|jgi:Ca-activated chloride channel family protein|nr:VWA domain-containing protein [Treponema sp.]
MSIGFEYPLFIAAGCIAIPLAILIARRTKNIFHVFLPLGAPGGIPFKPPFNAEALVKVLRILEYSGVFLLFVSAAAPVLKTTETVFLNRGADIIFVIDTSPSMAGIDMDGESRFTAAKKLLVSFAEKRSSDAIGLAAVGNDAALLVPPTTDREVLYSRLEDLQIAELGDGTALGLGLAVAGFHLGNSSAPRRAAVLITDGENNAGSIHPETAAESLRDLGVSLWVIGVGSSGEVPLDYVDPATRMRRTGTFESRFNSESFLEISRAGGGTYIQAPHADALAAAFASLDEGEMVIRRSGIITHTRSCRIPFMLCAIAFLLVVRFVKKYFLGAWV